MALSPYNDFFFNHPFQNWVCHLSVRGCLQTTCSSVPSVLFFDTLYTGLDLRALNNCHQFSCYFKRELFEQAMFLYWTGEESFLKVTVYLYSATLLFEKINSVFIDDPFKASPYWNIEGNMMTLKFDTFMSLLLSLRGPQKEMISRMALFLIHFHSTKQNSNI